MKIPTFNHAEYRLLLLQAEWKGATLALETIAKDIARHPEWNLEIGVNGPQVKTSHRQAQDIATQTPPKSNLSLVKALGNPSLSQIP
jgi:hypothetical protein